MSRVRFFYVLGVLLAGLPVGLFAQEPPSYGRQVKPFLARYCLECHNKEAMKGDLSLETVEAMRRGGKSGPVLNPGKPDESRIVLLPEHKVKPAMPPKKAKQPTASEVAVLRAWVAAGAKTDSTDTTVSLPDIPPRQQRPGPITALAYRPDEKVVAVGAYRSVVFVDAGNGEVVSKINHLPGEVTGLAFTPKGELLAVALSVPAREGQIHLYSVTDTPAPAKPARTLHGHRDAILTISFSPDGKLLASAGYDRLIKLWDAATGREIRSLRDHSDAVYGLSFKPDGSLLASAAADRAVKIWDVTTGARLLTLAESTDWVYAVSWHPDGRHLSAAGVDRSIRTWEVSRQSGRIVRSAFGHEAPVTRLLYTADGKTLFSVGEDRVLKSWDAGTLIERHVFDRQPEAVLSLALRPDQKQIAVGRFDGKLILLDAATGKSQFEPLPEKPKPPELLKATPDYGQRGTTIRVTLRGKHLGETPKLTSSIPAVLVRIISIARGQDSIDADLSVPACTPAGSYDVGVKTAAGASARLPFIVDPFPLVVEKPRESLSEDAQKVRLPASIAGILDRAGSVDYYQFDAQVGQEIGVQVVPVNATSKLDPVIQLQSEGSIVAESQNGLLGYPCTKSGSYLLAVRDRDYRGNPDTRYRLHIGSISIVTRVFPLGIQRGTEADVHIDGVNLGGTRSVRVKCPGEAVVGSRLPLTVSTALEKPLGVASVVVGEFREVVRSSNAATAMSIPVPGIANGRIAAAKQTDPWRFSAKKGTRLVLEVNARRIGSPLDSTIEILDAQGHPVPRAVLRSLAKTYVVFRDHDSANTGIRIENWSEFAMDDYVWVGNELLRIDELPKNPDDDCHFFSAHGQRLGFLDTTPIHLSLGMPMYKVAIHPPGSVFPPNGFPVITLPYRNDDGGPGYGKDSRLVFDPPADGDYLVRIGDAHGKGGPAYAYRLTIRPPRPDFSVSFHPTAPVVWKGSAVPITVSADRLDGFSGPIQVRLENVPAGFSASETFISANANSTSFALWADPSAKDPANAAPLKVVARAMIDGREVTHEATGQLPKTQLPGDIVTSTDHSEIVVHPGQQVWLTARIERRNGFKGRVPLEVRGLPRGVRVLDIGLNGILITEKDDGRAFAIYAEPWVQPQTHPFVVLAKHEGKDAEYAAKSVLLRIEPVLSRR
jgi:hypothetical protein